MFLDRLIKTLQGAARLRAPRRSSASASIKGGIKGDINRAQERRPAVQDTRPARPARSPRRPRAAPRKRANGQKKAAKMGLFSKKKKCPSCGEKLHASWDQCPYCGWSEAPGAPAAARGSGAGGRRRRRRCGRWPSTWAAAAAAPCRAPASAGWCRSTGRRPASCSSSRGARVVGTAADCDVVHEGSVDQRPPRRVHVDERSGFRVNDLGSTNGTYVNDKRVTNTRSHRQRQRPARSRQLQVQVDELEPMRKHATRTVSHFALVLARSAGAARAADKLRLERIDLEDVADAQAVPHATSTATGASSPGAPRKTSSIVIDSAEQGTARRRCRRSTRPRSRSTSSSWREVGAPMQRGASRTRSAPSPRWPTRCRRSRRWGCSATPPTPSG